MARKKEQAEEAGTEAKMNKADAVRAAIADGMGSPEEGVAYILKKFGLEVTKPQFSTYKSLDKKRGGKKTTRAPRAAASTPAAVPSNGSIGVAGSVEAIKSLVDQLGADQVVSIARLFGK